MLGLISFGPGMVALIHQRIVEQKKWMTEQEFREAVTFSELAPGPFTLHVAMYLGYHLHGMAGLIVSFVSFMIPSLIAVGVIALSFQQYITKIPGLPNFLVGVLAAILASMCSTVLRLGEKLFRVPALIVLMCISFVLIYVLKLSFILVILFSGLFYLVIMIGYQQSRRNHVED